MLIWLEAGWLITFSNLMRINPQVIFLGSPNLLFKLQTSSLNIGSEQIVPEDVVRNIYGDPSGCMVPFDYHTIR